LRPCSRTSFHHQPEAQHPKSSAIHKLPADYPIFRGLLRGTVSVNSAVKLSDPGRPAGYFDDGGDGAAPCPRWSISTTGDCFEACGLGLADCCLVSSLLRLRRAAARRFWAALSRAIVLGDGVSRGASPSSSPLPEVSGASGNAPVLSIPRAAGRVP
jgi:hypothetical protein